MPFEQIILGGAIIAVIVLLIVRRGRTAKVAADLRGAYHETVLKESQFSKKHFENDLSDLLPEGDDITDKG